MKKLVMPIQLLTTISLHAGQTINDLHRNKVVFLISTYAKPLFYIMLFSTQRYKDVIKVEIFNSLNEHIDDQNRFREIRKKKKRVFISRTRVTEGAADGWFIGKVHMCDGSVHSARDINEHEFPGDFKHGSLTGDIIPETE